jgi:hypothetical protein
VRKLIADKTPDQLKMPYALWTRTAVGQLIKLRFGIELPVRTMGLYLQRWGFTPQKPMKKAYEQSPAAVQKWLDEEHPVIAARAKVEGCGDSLGRRDRAAQRRGARAQLCTARLETGGTGEQQAHRPAGDFHRHQQGRDALEDFRRRTELRRPHRLPDAWPATIILSAVLPHEGMLPGRLLSLSRSC